METRNRKFTFSDESGNGVIVAEDEDGYPVRIETGDLSGIEEQGDQVIGGWESVVCPIIYQQTGQGEGVFESNSRLALPIETCVERLVEAFEDDTDTGTVADGITEEAKRREARVIIEYLVDRDVLEVENGEVVLMRELGDQAAESRDILGVPDEVFEYLLTWAGTLERIHDGLEDQYEQVDEKLENLKSSAEKRHERFEEMEERLENAQSELWDICDGEFLKPAETAPDGRARAPPEELPDEKGDRYIELYNDIHHLKKQLDPERKDAVEAASQRLNEILQKYNKAINDVEYQIEDMRMVTAMIHENDDVTIDDEFLQNCRDFTRKAQDALDQLLDATHEAQNIGADAIFDVEGETEEMNDSLNEAVSSAEASEERREETRDMLGTATSN